MDWSAPKRRRADFPSPTSTRRALETGRAAKLHSAPADYKSALRRFGSGYVIELMSKRTKETSEIVPGKEAGEQESDALNELKWLRGFRLRAALEWSKAAQVPPS